MGGADGENLALGGSRIHGRGGGGRLGTVAGARVGGWFLGRAVGRVAANTGRVVAVSEISDRTVAGARVGGWFLGRALRRVAANTGRAVAVSEVSDRIIGRWRLVLRARSITGCASAGDNCNGDKRCGSSHEPSWPARWVATGADQLHWTNSGDGAKLGPQHWMVLSGRSPHEWSSPVDTDAKAPSGGSAWPQ